VSGVEDRSPRRHRPGEPHVRQLLAAGAECSFIPDRIALDDASTIGRALAAGGVSWTFYAEGYAAMLAAEKGGSCPQPPDDCPAGISLYPCVFDPSDIPAEYYPAFADHPQYVRDYVSFAADLDAGLLAQVAFVKPIGYRSEHPGLRTTISDGARFVRSVVERSPRATTRRIRSSSSSTTKAAASSTTWRRRPPSTRTRTVRACRRSPSARWRAGAQSRT
jgi:hypothetical protein